jgi:hypothetical protein
VLISLNYRFQAAVNLELLEDVSDVVPRRGGADEEWSGLRLAVFRYEPEPQPQVV